jgi:hypothetical protein
VAVSFRERRIVIMQSSQLRSDRFPRLELASVDGHRLERRGDLPPADGSEAILVVSFEGISEQEARRVLAAFPGGARFRLASDIH